MKTLKRILFGLLILLSSSGSFADTPGSPPSMADTGNNNKSTFSGSTGSVAMDVPPNPAAGVSGSKARRSGVGEFLKLLPLLVLLFGIIVIFFLILHMRTGKMDSEESIKIIGIVLIITALLFIISSGTSSDTMVNDNLYAPAFGLLGTIGGYIFGRSSSKEKKIADTTVPKGH